MYCYSDSKEYNRLGNNMNHCGSLYNLNEVVVESGLEYDYIIFMEKLNKVLKKKYGQYFLELQLYRSREKTNKFYVITVYKPIWGVYKVASLISDYVDKINSEKWGCRITSNTILSFINYDRIIPKNNK